MARKRIGSIVTVLSAQHEAFSRGMKQAAERVRQFRVPVQKASTDLKAFSGILKTSFAGFSIAGVAAALKSIVVRGAELSEALTVTSEKLGIAESKLAGLQLAASYTRIRTETLNMALQRMVRRVAEAATGTGEAVKAIKELGLDARRLQAMGPYKAFERIAQAINELNSQSDRVRLAFKLFDSEGVGLVNTMALGTDAFRKAEERAKSFGLILDPFGKAKIEVFNEAMADAKARLGGFSVQAAASLSVIGSAFLGAADDIARFVIALDKSKAGMALGDWMLGGLGPPVSQLMRVLNLTGRRNRLPVAADQKIEERIAAEEVISNKLAAEQKRRAEADKLLAKEREQYENSLVKQQEDNKRRGVALWQSLRTQAEQYADTLREIKELYAAGAISAYRYEVLSQRIREKMADIKTQAKTDQVLAPDLRLAPNITAGSAAAQRAAYLSQRVGDRSVKLLQDIVRHTRNTALRVQDGFRDLANAKPRVVSF